MSYIWSVKQQNHATMKNTTISFQIINEGESVKTECLTAVIFGEPGVGKTSVSMTTDNPVLLDFDMGVQRSAVRKTAVRVDSWQGVQDLIESKDFGTQNDYSRYSRNHAG